MRCSPRWGCRCTCSAATTTIARPCEPPSLRAEAGDGDYRYATRCGPLRLVVADTTDPGRVEGRLGDERLAWLDARLGEEPRDADHASPCTTRRCCMGIPAWDAIGLADADRAALGEISPAIRTWCAIVAGHVHRAALGSVGGCPVFTCPSTWVQGLLDFGHPDELPGRRPSRRASRCTSSIAGEMTTHVQPVAEG